MALGFNGLTGCTQMRAVWAHTLRLLHAEAADCRRWCAGDGQLSKLAAKVGATSEAFVEANGHRAHLGISGSLTVYRRAAMRAFEGGTLDVALDTAPVGARRRLRHSWSRVLVPMGR